MRDLNRGFNFPQQNYDWGDAAAQILGAVMQRNQQRGEQKQQANMYGDVANFSNNLNNLDYGGQTTMQDLTPQGSNVRQQTGQGLLPTSFNTQTPTSANIGQGIGLLSGMNQNNSQPRNNFSASNNSPGLLEQGNIDLTRRPVVNNQDGSISTVRSMGVNIDGKEYLIPTVSNDGRIMSDNEAIDEFRRTGQHLGVFSSPESSNQYAQTLHEQQAGMYGNQQPKNYNFNNNLDKFSKENNPSKTTTSAPKTLQEQTSMIKSQIAPAMKELIGKYPNVNPKELLSMLQQATQDKIAEHTSNYQQQQMNDLYQGFVNEENPNRKAMYAARLKNMGYDVTSAYKEFAPDYVDKVVDSGDSQNLLSFDKKSGKYYDGGKLAKSVSPDARLNADTRIQTTGMNNATTLQAAAMRAARSEGSSRANHYEEGAGTKNGKRLDPLEKQKYSELYNTLLEDIWDSKTPAIREAKIQQHSQDLNELGYYMDRDVKNDIKAITG